MDASPTSSGLDADFVCFVARLTRTMSQDGHRSLCAEGRSVRERDPRRGIRLHALPKLRAVR